MFGFDSKRLCRLLICPMTPGDSPRVVSDAPDKEPLLLSIPEERGLFTATEVFPPEGQTAFCSPWYI